MNRIAGQRVNVRAGGLSPLAIGALVLMVLLLLAFLAAVAIVAIPVAVAGGLGVAAHRILKGRPSPIRLDPADPDVDGRQNVRVLRQPTEEAARRP